jgi:putative ABC transport system permease protein
MRIFERLASTATSVRRGLRQSRGTLVIVILTLAAAIGTNVAVLGLVSRALLTPPDGLADPDGLVTLAFERTLEDGRSVRQTTTSWPIFRQMAADVPAVVSAAAWQRGPGGVVVAGEQRPAETLLVSDSYFDVLGAQPRLGPGLRAGDSDPTVVISHRFWQAAFGGDHDVLGRSVSLRGRTFQVSGVMPEGFTGHAASVVDAWFPLEQALADSPGWDLPLRNIVSIVVRVREGERSALEQQAGAVVGARVAASPLAGGEVPVQDKRIAGWLAAVSALVFLIGLANAGTLLAVRASRHQRETLIRVALGATRLRLYLQIAGEALIIGVAAGAVSLLFGQILDDLVRGVLLPTIRPATAFDPLTIAGAALAAAAAAIVAFAAGALRVRVPAGSAALRHPGRGGMALQKGLLFVQVATSVLLLAGAGMFGRSLHALMSQDLGIDYDGLLVADFEAGPGSVPGQDDLFTAALKAVRELPGVTAATMYQSMPFSGFHVPPIAVPGRAEPEVGGQLPFLIAATPDFMDVMGIRVIEGRPFTPRDDRGAPVVIVNETMARGVWPGESAVGRCIRIGFDPDFDPYTATGPPTPSSALPCREVVGVARDTRQRSIVPTGSEAALMQYYVPFSQVPKPPMAAGDGPQINGLIIRTSRDPMAVTTAVRRLVSAGREDVPFVRVRPYADLFMRQIRPWRIGTTLLVMFGALAGVTAAVGLYAAFAHAVAIRRREMAIRLAIGATAASVRRLVVRDALVLTVAGAVAGASGALLAGRSMGALLYGIDGADPWVLGAAILAMLAIAWLATLIPAVSASRSDPNMLLRAE